MYFPDRPTLDVLTPQSIATLRSVFARYPDVSWPDVTLYIYRNLAHVPPMVPPFARDDFYRFCMYALIFPKEFAALASSYEAFPDDQAVRAIGRAIRPHLAFDEKARVRCLQKVPFPLRERSSPHMTTSDTYPIVRAFTGTQILQQVRDLMQIRPGQTPEQRLRQTRFLANFPYHTHLRYSIVVTDPMYPDKRTIHDYYNLYGMLIIDLLPAHTHRSAQLPDDLFFANPRDLAQGIASHDSYVFRLLDRLNEALCAYAYLVQREQRFKRTDIARLRTPYSDPPDYPTRFAAARATLDTALAETERMIDRMQLRDGVVFALYRDPFAHIHA